MVYIRSNYTPLPPQELNRDFYKKKFTSIRHVMHLEDYEQCLHTQALKSHNVDRKLYHTRIPSVFLDEDFRIIWFAPPEDRFNEHNYYGNVAFDININDIERRFGINFRMYYIEYVICRTTFLARILITRKDLERYESIGQVIDITSGNKEFMPVTAEGNRMQYIVGKVNSMKAVVQFMIDCEDGDEKWLFQICHQHGVRHDLANRVGADGKYLSYSCHKYNNSINRQHEDCPSPYSTFDSEITMKELKTAVLKVTSDKKIESAKNSALPVNTNQYGTESFGGFNLQNKSGLSEELSFNKENKIHGRNINNVTPALLNDTNINRSDRTVMGTYTGDNRANVFGTHKSFDGNVNVKKSGKKLERSDAKSTGYKALHVSADNGKLDKVETHGKYYKVTHNDNEITEKLNSNPHRTSNLTDNIPKSYVMPVHDIIKYTDNNPHRTSNATNNIPRSYVMPVHDIEYTESSPHRPSNATDNIPRSIVIPVYDVTESTDENASTWKSIFDFKCCTSCSIM